MYTQKQQEILEKAQKLYEEKKAKDPDFSQRQFADMVGLSKSAWSQLQAGTYQANPQKLFDTLEKYFSVKEKAGQSYHEVHYAPTSISEHVYELISVCQAAGGLAVAVGDAGVGKTKAAQKFTEDNPTNSYYIYVDPCLTSIRSLLKKITAEIGAVPERSCDEMWNSIVSKLSDGTVLIFDEAQNLTIKEIETLRSFSDYFSSRGQTLGICFIGNPEAIVYTNRKAEFAQVSNRIRLRRFYTSTQIQREDVQMLFPILVEQHMEKEIDYLYRIARTDQALRGAVSVFTNAYTNNNYSYDGLRASSAYSEITA